MLQYLIAAIVAAAIAFAATWQLQATRYEARLAEREAQIARAARAAEELARRREREMQRYVDEIARDAAKRQQTLAARAATTDRIAGQLRDDIARLNARPTPTDPAAARVFDDARRARELLGACAAEYRGVAGAADGLRAQVMGLQDYARSVADR